MKKSIILLGLILPTLSFGQIDRSIRPEAAEAPVINIKDSEVFKLDNGLTVILSENHKMPKVSFNLEMGSAPQTEGELAGLSEVTGALIMSGTSNMSKDELDNSIDYIGASLRASNSSLRLSCLTKHMNKGLDLMSDVLMNANFPDNEIDRIKKQYEATLMSTKSEPSSMASNVEAKVNFPNAHPYGEVMTEESLKNIDKNAIVEFYKNQFTPKGAYLVVVGDITKDELQKIANERFGKWTGPNQFDATYTVSNSNKGNQVYFVKKPGAVQSVIQVTYPIDIEPSNPDYLALTVLNKLLGGGGFGTRLMQNLREDKAYTYGCYSRLNVNEFGSSLSAGGNFRNDVTDSAIVQILFEMKRIIDEKVTDKELDLTKSSMAGSFARSLESPATVARFALNTINYNLDQDYYKNYLKNLSAISVADIKRVAEDYFTADKCNIVVVGSEDITDKLTQFDGDGKITKLDAFGNPVKDIIAADITIEELFEAHATAKANGASGKARLKKMKKLKTFSEEFEMSSSQFPGTMNMKEVWTNKNFEGFKLVMQGMTIQSSYFDGTTGANSNMQTGKKELTAEEIASKKKSMGFIPELNYAKSGMEYELLGMEEIDGKMNYVVKTNDGESDVFTYYDAETKLKSKVTAISTKDGETTEFTTTYSDYVDQGGFKFANTKVISIGAMTLTGKLKERKVNGKINTSDYM